ncbi:MAG: hemolysin III family protein [Clostridiaceae bacterium]|nr:hemolysin III family protein [Clostridiaceae bacterium]
MRKVKDPVSGFSHLFGAMLSIAGLALLIIYAAKYGEGMYDIVSFSIFGVGLILLYTFSSLYHLLNLKEKGTTILKKFDHMMIYVLIAATYTPMCLGPLRGPWGWSIFGVVWGLTAFGIVLTAVWIKAPRWLTTSIYICMGWIVVIMAYPLIKVFMDANAISSLLWLLAGGIFYTIGGVIYGLKKAPFVTKHFGFHEIFHIFVLLGSFCHFWFIFAHLLYI